MKGFAFAFVLVVAVAGSALADPLNHQFTYQGRLTSGGSPVNGPVTLRFSAWDALSGPSQIAIFGNQVVNVTATDGAFTAVLNSNGIFDTGDGVWLEISVCNDAACSSFTTLSPRQPLTEVPYAAVAFNAVRPWVPTTNNNYWLPFGTSIGLGNPNPAGPLDVRSGANSYFVVDGQGDVRLNGGSDGAWGLFNESGAGGSTQFIGQNVARLTVRNSGNVGIGTTSPASALDVRGDIRVGGAGDMLVPGGWENLRIIRGVIAADGTAPAGCCFSVSHPTTGQYDITFNQSFSSAPSTVASSTSTGGVCNVVHLSNGSVRVVVRNSTNATAINGGFHFVTMGER